MSADETQQQHPGQEPWRRPADQTPSGGAQPGPVGGGEEQTVGGGQPARWGDPQASAAVPPPSSGAPGTAPIPVSGHASGALGYAPGTPGYGPGGGMGPAGAGGYPGGAGGYPGGYPGDPGQTTWYGGLPYGTDTGGPGVPRKRSGHRVARALGVGLLAVLLAGGGGVIGGVVVHATDTDSGSVQAVHSTSETTKPVIMPGSLADIANKVKESVVSIRTEQAEGSGVILTDDGYILSNNHVVATARGNTVSVLFANGTQATATIVGTDPKTDLGVVKAQGVSGLKAATFGDSDTLAVGDTVLAIGSPLGLDGSVTAGIVSALNRTIEEGSQQQNPFQAQRQPVAIAGAIQTDAAINPGNSGGALVNTSAQVVGINTAILTSGSSEDNAGIGFAIPSNRAKEVANALMAGKTVKHPYIGVSITDADDNGGALVAQVVSGSPADEAGIKVGDVITKAGDTPVHTPDDLLNVVQGASPGDKLKLSITRSGKPVTVTVTVGGS